MIDSRVRALTRLLLLSPLVLGVGLAARAPMPALAKTMLTVEAESPGNVLRGAATVYPCRPCSGHKLVRWIGFGGSLNMVLQMPAAGAYTLQIAYANAFAARTGFIRANFDLPLPYTFPPTGGWRVIRTRTIAVHLVAGLNHLAFTNATGWCPDIDRVTIVR